MGFMESGGPAELARASEEAKNGSSQRVGINIFIGHSFSSYLLFYFLVVSLMLLHSHISLMKY